MKQPHFPNTPRPPTAQPAINAPKVVLWIIGITVAMHVVKLVMPDQALPTFLSYLVFNPANLALFDQYPLEIGFSWVGYGLVHAGWLHLVVNCAFLLAFGSPLARQIPTLSFVALYILGIVGGAVAVVVLHSGVDLFLVGASGGVSALVGALSRMVFLRRGSELVPPPFNNRRAGMIFVGIFILFNLISNILPGPEGASISGESHIGGFIAGFILSLLLPWRARRPGVPAND